MPFADVILVLLLLAAVAILALQLVLLRRGRADSGLTVRLDAIKDDGERLQRALREEQRAGREELQQGFDRFRNHVAEQLGGMSRQQAERIDGFGQRLDGLTARTDAGLQALAQRLTDDARKSREEVTLTLNRVSEQQQQRLAALTADNEKRMGEVRATLEAKLGAIQQDNAAKLEQMRATVDEKLQSTLETRLGQSFQLVSERLEAVQRGLGEMQSLASGVGDLKRVLTNVKSRGILGEVQLAALLEQLLTAEQYESNVITVPGSNERVEFAIRMPGQGDAEQLYLPIDAKFPVEDYQRLLEAQELADAEAAMVAGRALELRVREEAKRIKSKYVSVPHTTDFAVLFLPTEGLYAEVIRRPGLFELLQREHRVVVAGPTTLSALLNSLQMGFRTLAIAKRSSEVWSILGAVKTEFGKFGDVLDKVKKKLDEAGKHIDATGVRTRAIERKLRGVETLSGDVTEELLGVAAEVSDDVEEDTV
ncbi:DNA recombination protein RmuC [Frateuria hangzhouensis]|uniref:DNA recombination protein RmuC n=1 Tax=Frateuria hangzhouensis TaxID=2995589 RepID=UPI0022608533|nr:DNA recombination protein RmuC [Frateuria sp. STR12]MCX7514511.1 DNA recombination protein RmuC [Frateuria sp. STR12]